MLFFGKKISSDNNKYITEDRKVKFIDNIINENKSCQLCRDLLYITDKNIQELYTRIKDFHRDEYFVYLLQFYIIIRPKLTELYMELISLFATEKSFRIRDKSFIRSLFEYYGLAAPKNGQMKHKSVNQILFDFPAGSIQEIILNDDAEAFAKKIVEPGFDPKMKISMTQDSPLEFVKQAQNTSKGGFGSGGSEYTCMQLIAFFGSVRCFNIGISSGNFDIFDLGYFSIAGGSKDIVNILDQKGVSFDDCFEISTKYHQHEICDWLLKMHKCERFSLGSALEYYNDAVFLFLSKNGYGNIPLCIACCYDSVEAVTHLINDKGASVEERDSLGNTLLHYASSNGNISVVRYLVEACAANADAKDNNGITPLHNASIYGNISVVRYLVERCAANVDAKDNKGRTALDFAKGNAGKLLAYGPADKRRELERYLEERMKKV